MTVKKIVRKEPVAALVVGGLVGAGVALMVAPKSGSEMRQSIGRLVQGTNERLRGYAETGKGKVVDITEKGRNYVRGRKTLVTAAFAAGKEAYAKERERLAGKR